MGWFNLDTLKMDSREEDAVRLRKERKEGGGGGGKRGGREPSREMSCASY